MSNVYEMLIESRQLIFDEKNWCRITGARDAQGAATLVSSDTAVQFCAVGAVARVGQLENISVRDNAIDYLTRAARSLHGMGVSSVNDQLGHPRVIEMFDRAIELAKEEAVSLCGRPLPSTMALALP